MRLLGALGRPFVALERLDRRLLPGLSRRPETLLVLVGLLFLASGVARVSILTAEATRSSEPQVVTVAPAAPEQRPDDRPADARGVFPVGPVRGEDVTAYVAARRAELEEASAADPQARTVAVVSFDRYLDPVEAAALLAPVRVFAARYRLPVDDPFSDGDVARLTRGRVGVERGLSGAVVPALRAEAVRARAQAAELDALLASTDDAGFAASFQRDRNRLLAAAALVGPAGCACLYAVEVQADLATLAALLQDPTIRLVDVAPAGARAGAIAFTALLPEERGEVGGP